MNMELMASAQLGGAGLVDAVSVNPNIAMSVLLRQPTRF